MKLLISLNNFHNFLESEKSVDELSQLIIVKMSCIGFMKLLYIEMGLQQYLGFLDILPHIFKAMKRDVSSN